MILEVAILDVKEEMVPQFPRAFAEAEPILSSREGYISHQLQKCLEKEGRYLLLVTWEKLEDHTEGFRGSPEYQQWKALLHHFYEPIPEVEHYQLLA